MEARGVDLHSPYHPVLPLVEYVPAAHVEHEAELLAVL